MTKLCKKHAIMQQPGNTPAFLRVHAEQLVRYSRSDRSDAA